MTAALDILAARDDFVSLIGIVALLVIAAVAAAIQKAAKRQQEKRAAEQKSQGPAGGPEQPPRRRPPAEEEVARAMREVLGLEPEELQVRQEPGPRPRQAAAARPRPMPQELQPAQGAEVQQPLRPGEPTFARLQTDVGTEARIAPRAARMPPGQRQVQPAAGVAFGNVQQVRRAIIYHEIFSPPKALREGQEMWDF